MSVAHLANAVSDFSFEGEDIVQDKFNSSLHEQFSMLHRYIFISRLQLFYDELTDPRLYTRAGDSSFYDYFLIDPQSVIWDFWPL